MFSPTLYAKANQSVTLSDDDLINLKFYKADCDRKKLNLTSTEEALNKCMVDSQCQAKWTESKTIVGTGLLTTFLVGLLIGNLSAK